jgi:hypothetical protein
LAGSRDLAGAIWRARAPGGLDADASHDESADDRGD